MPMKLSRAQVNSWRLAKHYLTRRASSNELSQVVSKICGVQAQVLSAAQIGIGMRVNGISAQDVEDALWKTRKLVKTWCMRGTLHLLPAADLPLYVAALKTRIGYKSKSWLKFHKISLDEVEKITAEARNALDGRRLTREELVRSIVKRAGLRGWVKQEMLSGWGSLLHPAAYQGNLCFGPNEGKNVTFVRPDQWLGKWDEPSSEQALKTLVQRFVATYGPCSHEEFGHWWGVAGTGGSPTSTSKKIFSLAVNELVEVEFEGRRCWLRGNDIEDVEESAPVKSVRLLPSFDCYVMFYHPREFLVESKFSARVFRQLAGWNSPVVLINGEAAGTWQHRKRVGRILVEVEPFRPLGSAQKGLVEEEGKRLGEFLETKAEVSFAK